MNVHHFRLDHNYQKATGMQVAIINKHKHNKQ